MPFHIVQHDESHTRVISFDDIEWPWNRFALSYDLLYLEHWKGGLGFAVLQLEFPFCMASLLGFTWIREDGWKFEIQALWFIQLEVRFSNPIWYSFFKDRKKRVR